MVYGMVYGCACGICAAPAEKETAHWKGRDPAPAPPSPLVALLQPPHPLQPTTHPQVEMLEAKVAAAAGAYKDADSIAAGAMEAAEDAVRDEMECIAIFNETASALSKAVVDLRELDQASERAEEEFER